MNDTLRAKYVNPYVVVTQSVEFHPGGTIKQIICIKLH